MPDVLATSRPNDPEVPDERFFIRLGAAEAPVTLRLSLDAKATVNVGPSSQTPEVLGRRASQVSSFGGRGAPRGGSGIR